MIAVTQIGGCPQQWAHKRPFRHRSICACSTAGTFLLVLGGVFGCKVGVCLSGMCLRWQGAVVGHVQHVELVPQGLCVVSKGGVPQGMRRGVCVVDCRAAAHADSVHLSCCLSMHVGLIFGESLLGF